ncbi:MAG: WD40 repeat domain-containing protein, partial [Planctomycetota bacterium]|nr:WD40 repeat domain-containing protein [Planctomycetota bacterium]
MAQLATTPGSRKPAGPPPLPENLLCQPVVYTQRAAAVAALAASPWAPLVAIGGQRQILLYHSQSAQLLGVLPFTEGVPQVVRFSRSGTLLLAGGGRSADRGVVVLYDVRSGRRLATIGDELDTVLAADIIDDHSQVALGGPARVVRIHATADGALLHTLSKHTDWVRAVQYSPDGVLLASADRSGAILIWEAQTAREYLQLAGHKAAVTSISWRADSNVLATASEDGNVKLWEISGGKQIKNWTAHPGGAQSISYTRDGRLVTAGRDKRVKLWDGQGKLLREFSGPSDIALSATATHDVTRVVG